MLILDRLKSWALTALAVLLVVLGAYTMGGRASRKAANAKKELDDARRAAAGAKGVHDAASEINEMPDGAAAGQLRREWMRDEDSDAGSDGEGGGRT